MVAAGAVVVAAGMASCRSTAFVVADIDTLVAAGVAVVAMVFLKNFKWSRFRPEKKQPNFWSSGLSVFREVHVVKI